MAWEANLLAAVPVAQMDSGSGSGYFISDPAPFSQTGRTTEDGSSSCPLQLREKLRNEAPSSWLRIWEAAFNICTKAWWYLGIYDILENIS